MADDPWQRPIKDLKTDLGKARKDIDDVDKRMAVAKRSEDQEFLDVHKRLRRLKRNCADLDKRLTVTTTRLERAPADLNKRLKALEPRVA